VNAIPRRLAALGIAHTYEEFDDDHFGTSSRFDVSFPRLFEALSKAG
jgi:hypothetical protein